MLGTGSRPAQRFIAYAHSKLATESESGSRATKLREIVNTTDLNQIALSAACAELDAYLGALRGERGLGTVLIGLARATGDILRERVAAGELSVHDADRLQSELEETVFVNKSPEIYVPMFSRRSQV